MPAAVKGHYFYLYMIMDIYSRKIVAWEVHLAESAWLGADVFKKAALLVNIDSKFLISSVENSPLLRCCC